jgi:hypothetical protein
MSAACFYSAVIATPFACFKFARKAKLAAFHFGMAAYSYTFGGGCCFFAFAGSTFLLWA